MTSPSKLHPHIFSICQPFSGILLDAYGVFWAGNQVGLLSGAKDAMERLVSMGKIVGILSNSTQLASKEISKLRVHGLLEGKHFHFFVTSGEIAKGIFRHEQFPFETKRKQYYLFNTAHPQYSSHLALFEGTPYIETVNLDEADFIYLPTPHLQGEDQTDPKLFQQKVREVKQSNLPMVCPNPDRFAHEGNPPRLVVRQGSIAALYEELGGQVFYIGKPFSMAYSLAMMHFQEFKVKEPQQILMIGDTPETDIRGARGFGMATALITHTGIMAERIGQGGFEKTIHELPQTDYPHFLLERLGHDAF